MRENGKELRRQLLQAIMKWIQIESDALLDIYGSEECDQAAKSCFIARINELSIARSAIIDIFSEDE